MNTITKRKASAIQEGKAFSRRFKTLFKRSHLPMLVLAKKTGIPRTTLYDFITYERTPRRFSDVEKISKAFKVTPEFLLKGKRLSKRA